MSKSYTISWTASAEAAGWITGGFAVEQGFETGNDYICGGVAHERVAVWKAIGQTAYTVQNYQTNQCTGTEPYGSPFNMWSPNAGNRGGGHYGVRGSNVAYQGDRWLDTSGPAGGPP